MGNNYSKERKGEFEVLVDVYLFKEGDVHMAYSPALELSAYGDTEKEAQQSFLETIKIYISHCDDNGTLKADLKRLGWTFQLYPYNRIIPPSFDEMKESEELSRILLQPKYSKTQQGLELQL